LRILDTDICVAILRGNAEIIERRRRTLDRVATTWITAGELFYGAAKSTDPMGNRKLIERFLETLPILGLDSINAQFFGVLRAALEAKGKRLADADLWIGAIARAHRAMVVTGNTRHFDRIAGLQLENWTTAG
jgi:tRNA(fMet)-specific endonuclease VapC